MGLSFLRTEWSRTHIGKILVAESLFLEVVGLVLGEYGKSSSPEIELMAAGVGALEAWEDIIQVLGINETPQVLYAKAEAHLERR